MDDEYKYKTLKKKSTGAFKDRGSKFFAYAFQVNNVTSVKEKLRFVKEGHPKAVHHCYAYRIGNDGTQYRANDNGEPAGSAGRPILGQIDSLGLTNVLVVVARYFGGTLLGVPGLIHAYKTATSEALKDEIIVEKWIEDVVTISFDYPVMGEVMYLLRQSEATIYEQELQLFCNVKAGIPHKHAANYLQRLSEIRGVQLKKI